jgi:hypothetical protein
MSIVKSIYWQFQLIGWGCFAAINICFAVFFEKMAEPSLRYQTLSKMTAFVSLGLLSTHLMRGLIRRLQVVQKPLDKQFAYFFFLSVIFSIIPGALLTVVIFYWELLSEAELAFADRPILLVLNGSFYFFVNIVIWNLVYFIYHFVSASRRHQQDVWRLEEMMKKMVVLDNCQYQQEQK